MIDASLMPYQGPDTIEAHRPQADVPMSMYRAAVEWLKIKYEMKSQSQKTQTAYREALQGFEMHLQSKGLALESNPREVALAAKEWTLTSRAGRTVSTSTINQRYAILSSFYQFAIKFGACSTNPIEYCERPQRQVEDAAPALEDDYIKECLKQIDRSTREGKRDYTLLTLAVMTGRRVSELTGVQWKHISLQGKKMLVKWARCKGGKVLVNRLDEKTAHILMQFLQSEYGVNLAQITPESYLFQSHSRNNQGGRLSGMTVSTICKARLGFSKVHVTRHSHAVNAMKAGASLTEIGDQLGHSNYKTTADYLKEKNKQTLGYAGKLSGLFGIEEE